MRFIACLAVVVMGPLAAACSSPSASAPEARAPLVADGSHATRTAPMTCRAVHPVAVETAETLGYGVRADDQTRGEMVGAHRESDAVLEVLFTSSANGTCRIRVRADGVARHGSSDEQAFLDRLFAKLPPVQGRGEAPPASSL